MKLKGHIEDDMVGCDVEAEVAAMKERAERVRRQLYSNLTLPRPPEQPAPDSEKDSNQANPSA